MAAFSCYGGRHCRPVPQLATGAGNAIGHARQQRLQVLAQLRVQLPHGRRELLAVRAHQLQRNAAADTVEQQLQAPGPHVFAQVQPGLVGDAFAGHRPAPHHVSVVADQRAAHGNHRAACVDLEGPAIVGAAIELIDQAVVLAQILQSRGRATPLQIAGRGRQHAPVAFQQRQSHVVGVVEVTDADGHVDRVAEHVGDLVGQAQVQAQPRVRGAERAQPRQQQVAAEVRRRRQLQGAVQFGVFALHAGLALAQGRQYLLCIGQVQRAFASQAQAAGGAHEQAQVQLALQPCHRRGDLAGQQIGFAGGLGEAAQRGGADEQLQVVEADHLHCQSESAARFCAFLRGRARRNLSPPLPLDRCHARHCLHPRRPADR